MIWLVQLGDKPQRSLAKDLGTWTDDQAVDSEDQHHRAGHDVVLRSGGCSGDSGA